MTPKTGSVLVHYSGDFSDLLIRAAETGLTALIEFELGTPIATPMIEGLFGHMSAMDTHVQSKTGGQVDARTIALLGLIVAAGVQLFRGRVFGPAVPLIWYAAETVRNYYLKPNYPARMS